MGPTRPRRGAGAGRQPAGLTLDAGALIALERSDALVRGLTDEAQSRGLGISIPAPVLAQVWRDPRQVSLTRFLARPAVTVEPLDETQARRVGELLARTRTADVADASVVLGALGRGDTILTSDPGDLRRLDPSAEVIVV